MKSVARRSGKVCLGGMVEVQVLYGVIALDLDVGVDMVVLTCGWMVSSLGLGRTCGVLSPCGGFWIGIFCRFLLCVCVCVCVGY